MSSEAPMTRSVTFSFSIVADMIMLFCVPTFGHFQAVDIFPSSFAGTSTAFRMYCMIRVEIGFKRPRHGRATKYV